MLAFRNGFEYRNSDLQVLNGTIFATLCNFGKDLSTYPADYAGSVCTFWDDMAKLNISYQISQQVLGRTSPTFQHW